VAKVLFVVEVDAHDGGNQGRGNIRGIEPPAQTHLQDADIDIARLKMQERNRGQDLEVVWVGLDHTLSPQLFGGIANVKNETLERSVPNVPAGNRDSLANIHEVGRGIATDLQTTPSQGRIKIGAYRALAVCSGDKDTLE
jgi:hypothetical protein